MSTGQKIYHAVELFSSEEPHFDQFKVTFREALIDHGAPAANAEQMASIAAETLRDQGDSDYHLRLAHIITHHWEFERAIAGNPEATQAMHKYMSYYMDYAFVQRARAVN